MTKFVTPEDVLWPKGGYGGFEGPAWWGTHKYKLPDDPDERDKIAYVIMTTEGASYDAVNMYDRMIISVGLFQWAECNQALVTRTLRDIAHMDKPYSGLDLLWPVEHLVPDFSLDGFTKLHASCVNNAEYQRKLFLGGSSGKLGDWSTQQRYRARTWCSAMVNLLQQPEVQEYQNGKARDWSMLFMTPYARKHLVDRRPMASDVPLHTATFAIYQSYAANLPAVAENQLKYVVDVSGEPPWSDGWCLLLIERLVFGSGITIYPDRYNKLRPVVEKLYGVDLPDFASQLADASSKYLVDEVTIEWVQRTLVDSSYDLGPAGVDGKFGQKTTDALVEFQRKSGLEPTGYVDSATATALAHKELALDFDDETQEPPADTESSFWQLLDKFNPRHSLAWLLGNDDGQGGNE